MSKSVVRRAFYTKILAELRDLYDSGALTPDEGPVSESSELMHEFEEFAEDYFDKLETKIRAA